MNHGAAPKACQSLPQDPQVNPPFAYNPLQEQSIVVDEDPGEAEIGQKEPPNDCLPAPAEAQICASASEPMPEGSSGGPVCEAPQFLTREDQDAGFPETKKGRRPPQPKAKGKGKKGRGKKDASPKKASKPRAKKSTKQTEPEQQAEDTNEFDMEPAAEVEAEPEHGKQAPKPQAKAKAKGKPQAKAKAKAKAKTAGKPKAKAKGKAKAKAQAIAEEEAKAPKPKAKSSPKRKQEDDADDEPAQRVTSRRSKVLPAQKVPVDQSWRYSYIVPYWSKGAVGLKIKATNQQAS